MTTPQKRVFLKNKLNHLARSSSNGMYQYNQSNLNVYNYIVYNAIHFYDCCTLFMNKNAVLYIINDHFNGNRIV